MNHEYVIFYFNYHLRKTNKQTYLLTSKTFKVSMANEWKQRKLLIEVLADNLTEKSGFVENGGTKVNIKGNFHNVIPREKVWVKFGGVKGHESFKFNMQLCNFDRQNQRRLLSSPYKLNSECHYC